MALADRDGDGQVSLDELEALSILYSQIAVLRAELDPAPEPAVSTDTHRAAAASERYAHPSFPSPPATVA
jgi:hypothetical protein